MAARRIRIDMARGRRCSARTCFSSSVFNRGQIKKNVLFHPSLGAKKAVENETRSVTKVKRRAQVDDDEGVVHDRLGRCWGRGPLARCFLDTRWKAALSWRIRRQMLGSAIWRYPESAIRLMSCDSRGSLAVADRSIIKSLLSLSLSLSSHTGNEVNNFRGARV